MTDHYVPSASEFGAIVTINHYTGGPAGFSETVYVNYQLVAGKSTDGWRCVGEEKFWPLVVEFLKLQDPTLVEREEPITDVCRCGMWWCPVCRGG